MELRELRFPPEVAVAVKAALEAVGVTLVSNNSATLDNVSAAQEDGHAPVGRDSADATGDNVTVAADNAAVAGDDSTNTSEGSSGAGPKSPLLLFINARSGGRLGPDLVRVSAQLLSPVQVFDISTAQPQVVLPAVLDCLDRLADEGHMVAKAVRANLRIFAAGGDGTVDWLLSVLEAVANPPPLAIIPLGTGNNLARFYGWGSTFVDVSSAGVKRRLLDGATAQVSHLDSWTLKLSPSPDMDTTEAAEKLPPALSKSITVGKEGKEVTQYTGTFYNYLNCGMFAEVACAFHDLRNHKPEIARSPFMNKFLYAMYECSQGWFCASCAPQEHDRSLSKVANIQIQRQPGSTFEELPLDKDVRGLMFLNVPSYVGGRNPWGNPTEEEANKHGWTQARADDAKLEIMGLTDGWHSLFMLGKVMHGLRLAQVHAVRMELHGEHRASAFLHLDGEPWEQKLSHESPNPTVVEISRRSRHALMLSDKGAKALDGTPRAHEVQ